MTTRDFFLSLSSVLIREFHSFEVDRNRAREASGTLESISTSKSSGRCILFLLFASFSVINDLGDETS
ncbi:hypothetical protein HID58_096366 [Brassica napus]|uniref:Uncharacterized protein n=1 Tax=Brassica napus TaxID=3708 RepID=A0ABQ7X0Q1_BRANA|nr:hypothetical protein HID58_096366 [Brassica napus]